MKKIVIGFLGNLNYDTRTFNFFNSLTETGNDVWFIGFDWLTEGFKTIYGKRISIRKLVKGKFSLFFYLTYFISQLKSAFNINADIYLASDFFSLPALFISAKLHKKKILYDSREIFTELPFHENKPFVKKIIKLIESYLIKRVDDVFVTGEMDAVYLQKIYNITNFNLQRNLPLLKNEIHKINLYEKYSIPENSMIILYQGIVIKGRGIEIYFDAIKKMKDLFLIILGSGEHLEYYKTLSEKQGISRQTMFAGKVQQNEILNYTSGAFAGLSVIDNVSINNYYALPNKLFEYLMAGLPVIVNNLPQMKKIVSDFGIGEVMKEPDGNNLVDILMKWKNDKTLYNKLKNNCVKASGELNWEKEFAKNQNLFQ